MLLSDRVSTDVGSGVNATVRSRLRPLFSSGRERDAPNNLRMVFKVARRHRFLKCRENKPIIRVATDDYREVPTFSNFRNIGYTHYLQTNIYSEICQGTLNLWRPFFTTRWGPYTMLVVIGAKLRMFLHTVKCMSATFGASMVNISRHIYTILRIFVAAIFKSRWRPDTMSLALC